MLVPEGFPTHERLVRVLDELDETVFLADVEPGPAFRFSAVFGRPLRGPDGVAVDVVGRRVEEGFDWAWSGATSARTVASCGRG